MITKLSAVNSDDHVFGHLLFDGTEIRASSPGLLGIADSRIRLEGSPGAAWESLTGWSNGYLSFVPDDTLSAVPATEGVAGGQDSEPDNAS